MLVTETILVLVAYIFLGITILYLLLDNRDAATTLAWLLVFVLFPFGGLVLYFIFGRGMRRKIKKRLLRQNLEDRLLPTYELLVKRQTQETQAIIEACGSPERQKLMRLLFKNSDSILTRKNDIHVYFNGEEKFAQLLEDIKNARSYIHMEYFIWKDDRFTAKVVEALSAKAAAGVEVRILYDGMGQYLRPRYLKKLRARGIRIYPYYTFSVPFKVHTLNYRNHRKVVVIDGRYGYVGGMNMAEEYITGGKRFPHWRDTHIRIKGAAVAVLAGVFSVAWANTTKETITIPPFIPAQKEGSQYVPVQITTSGPDSEWESIKQLYFLLITSAEKTVYIQTPYFIPDTTIVMALKTAALSGIDVRVMLTDHFDKRLPYWVAQTFFQDLLNAGVRFFYYTKGFLHAKTIVIDSDICSIGTANVDIRSFDLNYEINALIHNTAISQRLFDQFMRDLEDSREYTIHDYEAIPRIKKLRNSLFRLFSPLL